MYARYKELRDAGVIDPLKFATMIKEWMLRIGIDFYDKEYERWPDAPCFKNSVVNEEYWELVLDERGDVITGSSTYSDTASYEPGDEVYYGYTQFYKFVCVKSNTNVKPATIYNSDSFFRMCVWIQERIEQTTDIIYKYTTT